ncbi:hypothetical protein LTR10_012525 [Elasticomyces elasticus]|nr:hypothetical protein LTR10_012525 [Elasticomyces elasticus]KAK4965999.1 hypothetical protein LTR42_012013 [Elasticomyces elasticus]
MNKRSFRIRTTIYGQAPRINARRSQPCHHTSTAPAYKRKIRSAIITSTGARQSIREQRPDLFHFSNVDRHACNRVVPMQVLSLGFSRTGTSSMQLALETLGYPTYHMTSTIRNIPDADMWVEAFDAKYFHKPGAPKLDRAFWDKLLGHVSATTDLPCAAFHEELRAAYPGVKCVLVEREVEAWYKSWYDVQIANYDSWFFRVVAALDPYFIGRLWTVATDCVLKGYVGGLSKKELEEKSRDVYRKHNEAVRSTVPADQLLVYTLGSGWDPLCAFLGKPVPNVPFPRVNETELVNEYVQILIRMGLTSTLTRWATYAVPVVVAAGAVGWLAVLR